MEKLASLFSKNNAKDMFNKIKIGLASPDTIRSWSYGEVKKTETINYRTFKPERDGLFCAKIFGPIKDYSCLCGKYKKKKYRGIVCEKCRVEVTQAKVRRKRMGHIELAAPVVHIWFTKSLPSRLGLLLNKTLSDIEKILYFEIYMVTDPGMTDLKAGQTLSEEEYQKYCDEYDNRFEAKMGAEAIRNYIKRIDLKAEYIEIEQEIKKTSSDIKIKKLSKRLRFFKSLIQNDSKPEWMILEVLPVLPPDLRPLVPLDGGGGRFVSSDLNDLYRRIINRNIRLKKLLELNAPEIIIRNEKRMLQESVDCLLDNSKNSKAVSSNSDKPLKSLAEMIKGKQGRFRQNLLGKRVDYSGRSVIVVGPELKLYQCGLPKAMALELFRPLVYSRLINQGIAASIKSARWMVDNKEYEVWDALENVIYEHPVLLNRAPTLHRLGVQAFEPILTEGKAIRLHPLVCAAFNADFDGDQMAVHLPLSVEAQLEARVLMMSTNNILSPSNGHPIIEPSHDMVLGIHYMTKADIRAKGNGKIFASINEVEFAYKNKQISIHAPIKIRLYPEYHQENRLDKPQIINTTVGRVIFFNCTKKEIPFAFFNKTQNKKTLAKIIDYSYRKLGMKSTVILADNIVNVGFKFATNSGISISITDFEIPKEKPLIIADAKKTVEDLEKKYMQGLITQEEKYNRVINIWGIVGEELGKKLMEHLGKEKINIKGKESIQESFNTVYMMAASGARGSASQIRQLSGIRGLMSKPDGSIIETPITANFREGLSVNEYFDSTHGARKGLADTALKTANSGYLTRRLVDVSQDLVVSEEDCNTDGGLIISSIIEGNNLILSLGERILGRVLAENVADDKGNILFKKGTYMDEIQVAKLEKYSIDEMKVRSVVTCSSRRGVCAKCYGRDLARGKIINIGEAVGIVAAQSIGEPGTQLTMRTFHVGGVASQGKVVDSINADTRGIVKFKNLKTFKRDDGFHVCVSHSGTVKIIDSKGMNKESYKIPYASTIYVEEGQMVEQGMKLLSWDPHSRFILSEKSGNVNFVDIIEGMTAIMQVDELTGIISTKILSNQNRAEKIDLKPRIEILSNDGKVKSSYYIPENSIINVEQSSTIKKGEVIAKISQEGIKTKDITGGLPKVADLFEARVPKHSMIMAGIYGNVSFGKELKEKRELIITSPDGNQVEKHVIHKARQINVYEGSVVEKGEVLSDGKLNPHDILYLLGINELTNYIINEVQEVYRLQGVVINDKHIECIINQMLLRAKIIDPGSSDLIIGEQIEYKKLIAMNKKLEEQGKQCIKFRRELLGITKASLAVDSFISAASFQESVKVLTEAAISSTCDDLVGLKENIMVGRLIPAGTGFAYHEKMKREKQKESYENNQINSSIDLEKALKNEVNSMESILLDDNFED